MSSNQLSVGGASSRSMMKRRAQIPQHEGLAASGNLTYLIITIDNYGVDSKFASARYMTDCDRFLSSLKLYNGITTDINMIVVFPNYVSQSLQSKFIQHGFLSKVLATLDRFFPLKTLDVTYTAPEFRFTQFRCLESLYGIDFTRWTLVAKIGKEPSVNIEYGHEWERSLAMEHRRVDDESKEVVRKQRRAKRAGNKGILGPDGYYKIQ